MGNAAVIFPIDFEGMKDLPKRIRERVKELQLKGVTQSQIAARGGFTQGALQNWMSGTRKMPRNLEALSRALECPVRWLMTGEEGQGDYDDIKLIATIMAAVWPLPHLNDEEKARIFIKAYKTAKSQPPVEDILKDGALPPSSPEDTSGR